MGRRRKEDEWVDQDTKPYIVSVRDYNHILKILQVCLHCHYTIDEHGEDQRCLFQPGTTFLNQITEDDP